MIVHGPYPLSEGRAVGQALAALNAGWEVDVVATRGSREPAQEVVDGVAVFRLPVSHEWGAGDFAVVREYVGFTALVIGKLAALSARKRYGVIHVHNPPDFLVLGALAPRLLGARIVLDVHDLAPELFALRFGGRRGASAVVSALHFVERLATRVAAAVITVHSPYQRELETRGVSAEKITVILNTLDERLIPSVADSVEPEGFRLAYHGTITPHYGVALLVEAAARLARDVPGLRLEIYGDGDALPELRSRIEELGISDRVHLSGRFLPQREVLELVQSASAGVICNLPVERNKAAIPTKLFEYARLGVPIVTADLPAIREHFSPREVWFFAAGDVDALTEALRNVAAAPDEADARASAARQRYEEYSWPANARRYVALLERLRGADRG
jgi:glycosyltransferase involved in cell wall biosynthesis